jgi:type II secretory pathway predicted ATPase ExeA
MYNEHFGLERSPFRITPDTKLFYPGGHRGEILEALIYAVTSGEGIVKVVGEVGSGKTMLCRMLEERLADKVDIVYLANPSLSPEETLHAIALEMKLNVDSTANRLQVMHALQERLLEKHADNRQVVVFVEEAQSMPIATLEEIRLLSNLETNRDKLLQIVLFGQPELDENLSQSEIRQLNERITHSFYLQAFTPEQMREYVNFRMRAVGYRGPDIFRGGAYRRMAKASEGLTRRINAGTVPDFGLGADRGRRFLDFRAALRCPRRGPATVSARWRRRRDSAACGECTAGESGYAGGNHARIVPLRPAGARERRRRGADGVGSGCCGFGRARCSGECHASTGWWRRERRGYSGPVIPVSSVDSVGHDSASGGGWRQPAGALGYTQQSATDGVSSGCRGAFPGGS